MIYLTITKKPDPVDVERRRRRKAREKIYRVATVIFLLLTGFCWGITPYCFQYADIQRGYDAIGGEAIVPLLPILLYYGIGGLCDMIIDMKGLNEP